MERLKDQDIDRFIANFCEKHPRLIFLLGEKHTSLQTKPIENKFLEKADIGFFETSSDMLELVKGGHIPREHAKSFVASVRDEAWAKAMPQLEQWCIPKNTAFIDENEEQRNKVQLAFDAFASSRADLPPRDPNAPPDPPHAHTPHNVHGWLENIVHGRVEDRLVTSNTHMVKTMDGYLKEHFPGKKPFIAVAIVGEGHLKPVKFGRQSTDCDMKHALIQKGYDVVSIELSPTPKLGPNEKDGRTRIYQKPPEAGNTDYVVCVNDFELFKPQTPPR